MKLISYTIFTLVLFFAININADDFQDRRGKIMNFFQEMNLIMNTRDKNGVHKFFTFYSTKDASFIINSALQYDKKHRSQVLKMNLEEYIKYLIYISTSPSSYKYQLKVNSWKYDKQSDSFVYTVNINEDYTSNIKDKEDKYIKIQTKVSTNCNYSFTSNPIPQISGANCLEEIVIQ